MAFCTVKYNLPFLKLLIFKVALISNVFLFTGFNPNIEPTFQIKETTSLKKSETNQCALVKNYFSNLTISSDFYPTFYKKDWALKHFENLQNILLAAQKQLAPVGFLKLMLPVKIPSIKEDFYSYY